MEEPEKWRSRAVGKIKAYFNDRVLRATLTCILLITGVIGFGISVGLLKAGMDEMWLRYPLAVLGAYGVFLLLVRLWAEWEHRRIRVVAVGTRTRLEEEGWQVIGTWFPWVYLKRDTGTPALPED